jgi:hypothetical protein
VVVGAAAAAAAAQGMKRFCAEALILQGEQ